MPVKPAPQFVVRRAAESDLPAILQCLQGAFEPFRKDYTPAAFADTILTSDTLEARLRAMSIFVAIAADGGIAGTIACRRVDPGHGHIRGMAVLSAWHGAGVAQLLLEAVEAELRALGCQRATLNTTKPLERAGAFYVKNGFRPTGKVKDFFGMPLYGYEKEL